MSFAVSMRMRKVDVVTHVLIDAVIGGFGKAPSGR